MARPLHRLRGSALAVGFVGALIGLLLFVSMLISADGDPFIIVAVGEDTSLDAAISTEVGRPIAARPSSGHDGKFFFVQALDPLVSEPFTAEYLVPTRYRAQRVLYPLLAGAGGTLPMSVVPWTMALFQILAFGLGSYAVAALAERRGLSPWWGMAFALNPGIWGALQIGGASTVAIALGLFAVLYVDRGQLLIAGAIFALSLLARETMVLTLLGVIAHQLVIDRRVQWRMIGIAALPSIAWASYLRWQVPGGGDTNGALDPPFAGFSDAWAAWQAGGSVLFGLITIAMVVIVLLSALMLHDLFIWSCVPFAALMFILSPAVLSEYFDYSRAIAPTYLAVAVLFAMALKAQADRRSEASELALS